MDESQLKRMVATVTFVVEKLARGQFPELLEAAHASRLSDTELKSAIAEYSIDIAVLPILGNEELDVVEITDSNPQAWSVDYDLTDRHHGLSNLTLKLTLIENRQLLMAFEIDDIHVL